MPSQLRILIFGHDISGLGHTARALSIAAHLSARPDTCSILLTDLPIIGRFRFPPNVDYVRLPGVSSHDGLNGGGNGHVVSLDVASALKIRRKIIQGVLKTFRPRVIVLERDPSSLPDEAERMLEYVRKELPEARVVWALPDVVGEPDGVIESWTMAGVYELLDGLCDEVWVQGDRSLFDQALHYRFPERFAGKVFYTGYLRSPEVDEHRVRREVSKHDHRPIVLLTVGGGAAGHPLVDSYLSFLESRRGRAPFESVIVAGPMMPSKLKHGLMERAERLPGVTFHRFSRNLLEYSRSADLVVSTGGYNTLCANLTYQKRAIVSPDLRPPNERLLRAQMFERLGITRLVAPGDLTPQRLGEMVETAVLDGSPSASSAAVPLDGLEQMGNRVAALANGGPAADH